MGGNTDPVLISPKPAPQIWDYANYRDFLRDTVAHERDSRSNFSVRQFCLKAGLSTENYLLKIIRGERKIGHKLVSVFSQALKLKAVDAECFKTLVLLELARTKEEREVQRAKLESLRRREHRLPPVQDLSMLRHWYLGAIWELASCHEIEIRAENVSRMLRPRISVQAARQAIEYLAAKGYLVEKHGKLVQSDVPILTSDERASELLRAHHREHILLAVPALELPISERGFYGLTLAVNHKRLPEMKAKLKAAVDALQSEFSMDPQANSVYRIQAQVYPLSGE